MYLTRYLDPSTLSPRVGAETESGDLYRLDVDDLHDLLSRPLEEIHVLVDNAGQRVRQPVTWMPPVSGRTEVWASGVTYLRSREARVEESNVGDVYTTVYDADRPELFFKSVAWRVVTDGEPIGIRADSALDVPEPEVALVANSAGELVGYTVCDDVSSRSIEGENPLYLPQAKVYAGACALHRRIRLASAVPDPQNLTVRCSIRRGASVVWEAETSTSRMRRTFDELLSWAFRGDHHPHGMVLSTGTGIVPDLDLTLEPDDVVTIDVEGLGSLSNPVVRGTEPFPPAFFDRR